MRGRMAFVLGLFLLIGFAPRVSAVITAKTPLEAIESRALYIVVGKVEKYFPEKPAMLVAVTEDIKGKAPFRHMPINCKVADEKAFKANQIEPLLKRFGPDVEIVFFMYAPAAGRKNLITFAYTNGTWFQVIGTPTGEKDNVVFGLVSAEPYFRKTFQGTNDELRKALKDHVAKKAKLPPLDEKAAPGFGPEYTPKKAHGKSEPEALAKTGYPSLTLQALMMRPVAYSSGGSLFGVIATPIALGPLFLLAMLFPSIFGRTLDNVTRVFMRLLALMTAVSVVAVVLGIHGLLNWLARGVLRGSWWGDFSSLWLFMTLTTIACTLWAWRRHLNWLYSGEPEASAKTELVVLGAMSVGAVLTSVVFFFYLDRINWSEPNWIFAIVFMAGMLAGLVYRLWQLARRSPPFAAAPMSTEGVILGTMLLGCLLFAPRFLGGASLAGAVEAGERQKKDVVVAKKWEFTADVKGMFASSPLVDGDYVYASYSETVTRVATLVKIERQSGLKKWEFIGKNEDLMEMISTPCVADGKLYFGEGFHDDKNCKVYCVDAETGKEVWRFQTGGQTESSPAVANGKVYIGAGNDGVYCLDAKTGKELWKYPPKDYKGRLQRFGGGMTVVGNQLYCGTGVDRNEPKDKGETAVFCFADDTGKLLWKAAAPYPVWSTPVVKGEVVYVTSGNGDVTEDAKPPEVPGGALLSLDAKTGKEHWRFDVKNGIIEAPAVDAYRIYFGCRDGNLYCVERDDGKKRWSHFLDSPIIGTPVLDTDSAGERTAHIFATAAAGKVACLTPLSGNIVWSYNLTNQKAYLSTSPRLAIQPSKEGTRRHLYFGSGVGGGVNDVTANRPVFFCLEDVVNLE